MLKGGGGDVTKDFQRSKGQRSRLDGNNNQKYLLLFLYIKIKIKASAHYPIWKIKKEVFLCYKYI